MTNSDELDLLDDAPEWTSNEKRMLKYMLEQDGMQFMRYFFKLRESTTMIRNWHHYVIGRGNSIIEGSKVGTLKEVTEHAKDLAERINARSDKYGVTYVSSYSPRKKS